MRSHTLDSEGDAVQHTRIGIVDDHHLVVVALESLIAEHPSLAFMRHTETVAAMVHRERDIDLVLLDLQLRDDSTPTQNIASLTDWGADVLVLTSGENPYLVREASRADPLGIVRKSAPTEAILDAILSAARGEATLSPEWASAIDTDPLTDAAPLSDRERQVLELYASGVGAKQVAAMLCISENTVNDHLRRIKRTYRELGRPANTKVDLYQRGLEDGFVLPPHAG